MAGLCEGKVALVTGGGSGIGRSSALAFARAGAAVAIADVDPAGGEETLRPVRDPGGRAIFIRVAVVTGPRAVWVGRSPLASPTPRRTSPRRTSCRRN